ncbi:hypothetical protein [Pelagicoccus mobilis]|uniref:Uncharacterized protein n=1 Tax=Pelagicoccus mobilis TaxID=415221 RepID=A0A934VTK4_9BACT|nr:hypothetical protein [Pelagicoccus mobilis]MBK1879604.1 hypothetical protein [Pelagicoccus mobilis]
MSDPTTLPATTDTSPNWANIEQLVDSIPSNLALPIGNNSHPTQHQKALGKKWENATESFSFAADAKASLSILNQKKRDPDPLRIWASKATENLASPLLQADDRKPYLKYGIEAGGSLNGTISLGSTLPTTLSSKADFELGFYAYRQHNSSKQLGQAIIADATKLRTPLRAQSIRKIEAGNALAMKWNGSIDLKAKVDWTSLASAIVSKVSALNLSYGLVDVEIDAEIFSNLDFALEDSFLLVFSKSEKTNQLVVEVRKDHRNALSAAAGFLVSAKSTLSAKSNSKLKHLKTQIGAQILGLSSPLFERLESWAASAQSLPEELQEALANASDRIFGKPPEDLLQEQRAHLRQTLDTWCKALEKNVEETARQEFELSLQWSYRKVKTNEALIRVAIPSDYLASEKFTTLHKELRKGKLSRLQSLAKSQKDGNESYFLKTLSTETISKFSLGISFGDFAIGNATTTSRSFSWMENRAGQLLPSFLINTDRKLSFGKEAETLFAGATAMGNSYQAEDELRISNLNFDLTLNQSNHDEVIDTDEIIDYLDTARIWNAFPQDLLSLESAVAKLMAKQDAGKILSFNSKLHLSNEGVEKLLGATTPNDSELWGDALALSLHAYHWSEELYDLDKRKAAYSDAARIAFESEDLSNSELSKIKSALVEDLQEQGHEMLAKYELRALKTKSGRQASKRIVIQNYKYSLTALRDSLLIPLCLKRKDLFKNLKGLQEFARLLHVDTEEYEDRKDFENEVHKHFDLFKYLRRNRALFRAIGCYAHLKSLSFPEETRSKLLTATFQVIEKDSNGNAAKIIAFADNHATPEMEA